MSHAHLLFPRLLAAAFFLALFSSLALSAPQAGLAPDKRLNILFIMSDQHNARSMGYSDNGYGGVGTSLTPELDQLAQEGIRFETALCPQPQCSPTRYSYITGLWPHSHGLRWNGIWEPRGIATLPHLARDAGYETATIGKHHLTWLKHSPATEDLGFNLVIDLTDYVSFVIQSGIGSFVQPGNFTGMMNLPLGLANFTGFTHNTNEFHPAGFWADQTIEFLDARAADAKPFLCYYSMFGPHPPITPTGPADAQDWAHMYHPFTALTLPPNQDKISTTTRLTRAQSTFSSLVDDQWREILSYYYGFITQIDYNIGRVLERLDQLGLAENTLVIYTADHGEMSAEMRVWQKGGGNYDALTRVPLILRLPGVVVPGQVGTELVNTIDLIPTILELSGIPIGEQDRTRIDGRSLVDILVGNSPPDWPEEVFSEFGSAEILDVLRTRMVRTATHKYSFDELGGGEEEFYDLVNDEFEITNLINDADPLIQAKITDLRSRLDLWWNNEAGHAPQYLNTGESNALPSQAAHPVPANGSLNIARDINPSWLPSTAAVSQRVYVGGDPIHLALFSEIPGTENNINPGTMLGGRNFYWRVDQVNGNGTTLGALWYFQVTQGTALAPSLAVLPFPAHRATGTGLVPLLKWTRGKGTRTQKLFFGEKGNLQLVRKLQARIEEFQLGRLLGNVTYEWRVDSIRSSGETEGHVWSFTTNANGLPRATAPVHPLHMDEAAIPQPGIGLSWIALPGAQVEYDVYFGRTFPLEFQQRQTGSSFDHGLLNPSETYFWRIDSVNNQGVVAGFTWRFTTAP